MVGNPCLGLLTLNIPKDKQLHANGLFPFTFLLKQPYLRFLAILKLHKAHKSSVDQDSMAFYQTLIAHFNPFYHPSVCRAHSLRNPVLEDIFLIILR